jgi:hypothetical protein
LVTVRYIADDVDATTDFYVERLPFDAGNPIELFQPARR